MLQVYVYGKDYQGYLELPPATTLDLEIRTDLFDEDLTLGAFSDPLSADWTDHNKKIFGFIEMINGLPETEQDTWKCDVYNNWLPELVDAKLTLLSLDGSFSYEKGKYSFTISGNKGLFGTLIGTKTLRDLTIPAIHFTIPTREFATAVMKGIAGYDSYPYLRFAPVAMLNFFDKDRTDYDDEFLARDIANNIVIYDVGAGTDWAFGRPTSANTFVAATPGNVEYTDYRTIPFFTYKWIAQQLFKQFGYTVQGEWLDDPAWDDAVMFNNFGIERYNTASFTDLTREIQPAKHLPKKPIGIFLRDLLFLFNVKFSFLDGQVVSIDYRKTSLKRNSDTLEASSIAGKLFNGNIADFRTKGFTLSYNFDTADSYNGEKVKDVDVDKLVATIDKHDDFGGLNIGRDFEFGDIVFVIAENQYYIYSYGSGIDAWDYYSEKLTPYVIGTGEYKYDTGISPMVTYVEYDEDTDKLKNMDMVAADMHGSYYAKRFALVENDFDTRIFFIKNILRDGLYLPTSFVNNRDRNNMVRTMKSLAWDGDDGLYQYLWKDWLNFLNDTRIVKTTLRLDQKTYNELKSKTKVSINGTSYLTSSISPRLPLKEPVGVELYRR